MMYLSCNAVYIKSGAVRYSQSEPRETVQEQGFGKFSYPYLGINLALSVDQIFSSE